MSDLQSTIKNVRKYFFNIPQIRHIICWCQIQYNIWGRATGKSEGPEAYHSSMCAVSMPGSKGIIAGDTLVNLRAKQLPPVIEGWIKLGFVPGLHFFINEFPPKKYFPKWEPPIGAPTDPKDCIFWWNGSMQYIFGLDRNFNNAVSADYMLVLEAKNIRYETFTEMVKAVRGNEYKWGERSKNQLAQHGSLLISSDMPTDPKGLWLLENEKEYDEDVQESLLIFGKLLYKAQKKLNDNQAYYDKHPRLKKNLEDEIYDLEYKINDLRIESVGYHFASTLDNLDVLGFKTILQFEKTSKPRDFVAAVLGERVLKPEKYFYSVSEDRHGYTSVNYEFVDRIDVTTEQPDCRWYSDVLDDRPIDVALDYNYKINWLVAGQLVANELRTSNSFYTLVGPEGNGLKEVVKSFCQFYQYRDNRTVVYHFNQTAYQGRNAISKKTYYEQVRETFESEGWFVIDNYTGVASTHNERYYEFKDLLNEEDPDSPVIRFNLDRCQTLLICLGFAPAKTSVDPKGKSIVKKDKSSETSGLVKPEHATHGTEAWDELIEGILSNSTAHRVPFSDIVSS